MTMKQVIHKEKLEDVTSAANALQDLVSDTLQYAMVLA